MLKASALYIVIIIALVIGLLCSALIVAAYFYKQEYQKKFRYGQLQNNLGSGINLLLASDDTTYSDCKTFSLFNNGADSVSLKHIFWGVYDIGVSEAFTQTDTLYKVFSIANSIDSAKWAVLYLKDEERPFSLSGKTTIRGDAWIPEGGVKSAYIDNRAYQGDKQLIIGKKHFSEKELPLLQQKRLQQLEMFYNQATDGESALLNSDSIQQSFLLPTRYMNFKKQATTIEGIKLGGNIVLLSDTVITIDSTASLDNIIIFAKSITVKSGFRGRCQLFATDSVNVERQCHFDYPSCIGVLRFTKPGLTTSQEKISLGEKTELAGVVFTYEKMETPAKPMIDIGKRVKITGQVYSQGFISTKDSIEFNGSVFTGGFIYKNGFTLYQNYLINMTIDSKALSPYYLTSDLIPVAGKRKKVLQWLETN